jgi:hypothetical protein
MGVLIILLVSIVPAAAAWFVAQRFVGSAR